MNPITLTISTGRCGTTFLEKSFKESFQGASSWISHEYLRQNVTKVGVFHRCYDGQRQSEMANEQITALLEEWRCVSKIGPVVDFGWTMRSLIPYFYSKLGDQLRVLYVHRHPVSVAASFAIKGSYSIYNSSQWAITPSHPNAMYPQFGLRWGSMTPYEKCLYLWLEVNSFALEIKERYPELPFLEVRSEQLFKSDHVLAQIAEFTGFLRTGTQVKKSVEDNRTDVFSLERRPLKEEWKNYRKHPELVEFAEKLGYCMDQEHIAGFIWKYQLPKGLFPLIRHKTGYWAHRENMGRLWRRIASK